MTSDHENRLDRLFQAYREAAACPEASADFMPGLWARIESRRSGRLYMERLSRLFATAALAVAVVLAVFASITPPAQTDETWVETIANHSFAQQGYAESVRLSPASLNVSPGAQSATQEESK